MAHRQNDLRKRAIGHFDLGGKGLGAEVPIDLLLSNSKYVVWTVILPFAGPAFVLWKGRLFNGKTRLSL